MQGLGAQISLLTMGLRGPVGPGEGRREICAQAEGCSASQLQPMGLVTPAMTNIRKSWESGF